MIEVAGALWGTAAEVAEHIGNGVTEDAVRWWGRHDGLARVRMTDEYGRPEVRFQLRQAICIDASKRAQGRGRRRAA